MRFESSLWDDSDPTYAPCTAKVRGRLRWQLPKKYRDAGYSIKTFDLGQLENGAATLEQARQARELTRDLVQWYEGQSSGREAGTWGWLIGRYLNDEYSDIQFVRPQTRAKYQTVMGRIEDAIKDVLLAETDYTRLMEWRLTMERKGRSASYIKKWFTHWGLALSHGVKLGDQECRRIKAIREEMRIANGASRAVYATSEQVNAIVGELDRRGLAWASLAVLLRFEFSLRGTDVYGQWEPTKRTTGGIIAESSKGSRRAWVDGITWDMIDPAVTNLRKVISKTRSTNPEPLDFPIDKVPELRRRLLAIPEDKRVGPVIVCEDGLPPRHDRTAKVFKQAVRALKLPDDLQLRDTRSGGITEGSDYGNPFAVQHAAQHSQISTTNRYIRDQSRSVAEVVEFRQKGRKA